MLYVGIDQHKRHLTICVRDEQGDIALRQQVSTNWLDVDRFLERLGERGEPEGGYVAIMEVCGFNGWLVKRLNRWGCSQVYIIAAPYRVRQKTDRRDAAKLSELLWINRDRIAAGEKLVHVSVIYQPTEAEQHDRQLTRLRHRLGQELTRIKNSIKQILRRHNLEQECPTKGTFTQAGLGWLTEVHLPDIDRIELDMRLAQYKLFASQIKRVDKLISLRARHNKTVPLLRTLPRIGDYTALALWAYIGPIQRFPRAKSLANFFGITPGCRNSGDSDRPGSITKAGHPFVRFLLAQMVLHALRGDPGLREWYRRVKRRRGAKIARVAVMRRLCEALWHMLTRWEAYRPACQERTVSGTPQSRPAA
jgi:transposase